MASHHGSHNQSSAQVPGQAQMRRDQPSDLHSQDHESSFLQETGAQMMNMAQGAVSMAKGAAAGAANIAHGAADAVKNTLGMNNPNSNNSSNSPPNDPHCRNDSSDANRPNNSTHGPGAHPSNPRI